MLSFIFNPFTGNFDAILIGANQALSNLTSPTALNQSILPGGSGIDLGGSGLPFHNLYLYNQLNIQGSGGIVTPNFALTTSPISGFALISDSAGNGTWQNLSLTYIPLSQKGAVNGVATLDGSGKVPVGQLPSVVMEYQGSWNPNTNTPALSDGTGTNGNVYYVAALRAAAVAGNTDPSMVNFQIGDLVIYSSSVGKWQLVTPAAGVSSVNGAQGAVIVNAINQLTGDATAGPASGSQSQALTFATVNANVGSFGSSTSIPSFTVNAKGLITAASGNAVIAPAGTLSGTTLNATVVNSSLTSVGTIVTGVWNGTALDVVYGGTGQTTLSAHDVLVGNGTSGITQISPSTSGLILTSNGVSADPSFQALSTSSFTAPTVQKFTSSSGTYTTPTSPRTPLYIKVKMVGGGGGGAGGGATPGGGGAGGNTTFGTSLLTANGGAGASSGNPNSAPPIGGGVTVNSPAIQVLALKGGDGTNGGGASNPAISAYMGASGPWGGAGGGGSVVTAGSDAAANSGSGGGGGPGNTAQAWGGNGSAGGFIEAIITSPSATYNYAIGVAGTAGTAGTNGGAGGAGGSGVIVVEEYYQ